MTALKWIRTQWDRVSAWVFIALGGLFIVLGWVSTGREALTAQQIPYIISGGIGGLFMLGLGAMLWLSADLRDEWRKLDSIEQNTRRPEDTVDAEHAAPVARSANGAAGRPHRRERLRADSDR